MNKKEITLCVLKPDANERGIVEQIINDIREQGFEIKNFVKRRLTVEDVKVLYYESMDKPYFIDLLSYMTSGICVYFLVKSNNAIKRINDYVGATNPLESSMGTLRQKYGINILKNTIHSSNANRVQKEINQLYKFEYNDSLINFPDYFKLKDGTICHTISEQCYEDGKIIGIPKYFKTRLSERGSRIIEGVNYVRNDSIDESILYSKLFTSINTTRIKRFGEEICLFELNDIEHVYNAFDKARELYNYNGNESILNDTKMIINIMINDLGTDLEDIGIEGSILIGGYQENSDIDIIVKGVKSVEKLYKNFKTLKNNRFIKFYDESDLSLIFSRRKKYSSFETLEEMLKQECNRTVGLINGRRFWMQPILGDNFLECQENRRLYKIKMISSNITIIDSKNSFLWPSFYTGYNKEYGNVEIECYDPVYMNQAIKGDQVYIEAPIYIDFDSMKKIIIFASWIREKQIFKKI